jgi:hypothetical protein
MKILLVPVRRSESRMVVNEVGAGLVFGDAIGSGGGCDGIVLPGSLEFRPPLHFFPLTHDETSLFLFPSAFASSPTCPSAVSHIAVTAG